jgi:predicted nucleic acid-binding protein
MAVSIVDHGGDLYRRWHPSHGIDIHDAILAATVAATGGKIYTQNLKHYPMPDVAVSKGWLKLLEGHRFSSGNSGRTYDVNRGES